MLRIAILLLFCVLVFVRSDCECGPRCQRYSHARQCSRCCSATVRRSVEYLFRPAEVFDSAEGIIPDVHRSSQRTVEDSVFYEIVTNVLNRKRRFNPRFNRG